MQIEVEHNGEKLAYSENRSLWYCHALNLEAPQLATLKTKVNAFLAKQRRVAGIECLFREYSGNNRFERGKIVLIDGDGKHIWVEGNNGRRKITPDNAWLVNDDNMAKMEAFKVLRDEAREANKKANDALEAIPRVTIDGLRSLKIEETEK